MKKNRNYLAVVFVSLIPLLAFAPIASAKDITLVWDANTDPIDGYRIFYHAENEAFDFDNPAWEGTATTCTIYGLDDCATYFFLARSYRDTLESGDSNTALYQQICQEHPIANAGQDDEIYEEEIGYLYGGGSYDPDGAIESYYWLQLSGPTIIITNPFAMDTDFLAPEVENSETAIIQLTVTDYDGLQAIDQVVITILPLSSPVEIPGDCDSDGDKDGDDLQMIVVNRFKPITTENEKCDINNDGAINNYDILAWRRLP